MILRTGTEVRCRRRRCVAEHGLTLIELILVMALLATVAAMSVPHFTGFLSGRSLREEARRMVAATRYARSEAMSSGVATELWINLSTDAYGVRHLATEAPGAFRPVQFTLREGLSFEIEDEYVSKNGEAKLLFWPDGSLDETSVERIRVKRDGTDMLGIVLADSRLGYVVREVDDEDTDWTP